MERISRTTSTKRSIKAKYLLFDQRPLTGNYRRFDAELYCIETGGKLFEESARLGHRLKSKQRASTSRRSFRAVSTAPRSRETRFVVVQNAQRDDPGLVTTGIREMSGQTVRTAGPAVKAAPSWAPALKSIP